MLEGLGRYLSEYSAPITGYGRVLLLLGSMLAVVGLFSPKSIQGYIESLALAVIVLLIALRQYFTLKAAVLEELRVVHEIKGRLVEGGEARIVLRIINNTPILIERLDVVDSPPRLFRLPEGIAANATVSVPAYGEAIVEYPVKLVVGEHEWGETRLVLEDPLSLFRVERRIKARLKIRVQPRLLEVPRRLVIQVSSSLPAGVSKTGRKGYGTEFYSVREYMPGDDIRLVEWKAYARLRKLMIKEFEQEVLLYAAIIVDVTPSMVHGVVGETKLEYSLRIAASLATYFASRGDYYILLLLGSGGEAKVTPWLKGRRSSIIALRTLSQIAWPQLDQSSSREGVGLERPKLLSSILAKLLPREKTIVMLLSDFYEDIDLAKAYAESLNKLKRLRHEVLAVVPLTTLFEVKALGGGVDAAMYRLLAFERIKQYREIFRELRAKGVTVAAAGPTDLLTILLQRLEAYRRLG